MAKEEATTAPEAAKAAVDAFPLTLAEFCTRLSATDRRVEMIGAFEASEKAAGRTSDLEASFASRFVQFCGKPA